MGFHINFLCSIDQAHCLEQMAQKVVREGKKAAKVGQMGSGYLGKYDDSESWCWNMTMMARCKINMSLES